jgi:hypothetical protein
LSARIPYHQFFAQFGEVACVTVHKNNGDLLHTLAKRETILREIDFATGMLECVQLHRFEDHLNGKVSGLQVQ